MVNRKIAETEFSKTRLNEKDDISKGAVVYLSCN